MIAKSQRFAAIYERRVKRARFRSVPFFKLEKFFSSMSFRFREIDALIDLNAPTRLISRNIGKIFGFHSIDSRSFYRFLVFRENF